LRNLAPYGGLFAGMELAILRREVQSWLERIQKGEDLRGTLADLPKLHFIAPTIL